ncbi:hypothetical protein GCM10022420_062080 [Streptomyces iranensis]|uniref:Lipoprotein n=2 Tax=Streptomyces iranensis TaxID=576784 RepID=A0A060ZD63_9ACTN|nr:predicted protein [Streptomyces iranensis]
MVVGMRNTKTAALLCATAMLSLALTACGGGSGVKTDKGVDSVNSDAPAAGGKADTDQREGRDDVTADRPQLRLDSSEEERARLNDAYNACLEAKGVPMNHERAQAAGAEQAPPVQDPAVVEKHKAGYDACLVKLPRQPPETEPDTNPRYADDYRAYVKCLNKNGMRVHMVSDTSVSPDGLAWRYDDGKQQRLSEAEQTKVDRSCELEAFSD